MDIIVVRKEGAADSHHNFCVRRAVVLHGLQWLVVNNKYYKYIRINAEALALLPEDGDLTDLQSVSVESTSDHIEEPSGQNDNEDMHLQHNSFWFFCSQCCSSNDRAGDG